MNSIREIQRLNKLELENGVAPEASWHRDHADSAYIYIGGLPFDLSEGDIITIFSQYGEPTFVKLVRDKETGKSKGFAFLKYEDQRSTDLAVDNLGGATVMGRVLKVDHTRYKRKDDEEEEDMMQPGEANGDAASDTEKEKEQSRPMLKEEKELAILLRDQDEDDPMKEYLIQEKKEEVAKALAKLEKRGDKLGERSKHRHHHRHKQHAKRHSRGSGSEQDGRRLRHRSTRDTDLSEEEKGSRRRRLDRRRSRSPR
ncbi:MAG: hypothetical protein LQ346_008580 [Caloplaca aetnensis]|nr:MAG: hypothetical protein LQ346_008580 [Caloplaca aetnensis]